MAFFLYINTVSQNIYVDKEMVRRAPYVTLGRFYYRVGNQNFPQLSLHKQTNNGLALSGHSDISRNRNILAVN